MFLSSSTRYCSFVNASILYPSLPALIRQGIFWNKDPEQPVDNFVDILLARAFRHARGVPAPNGTPRVTKKYLFNAIDYIIY